LGTGAGAGRDWLAQQLRAAQVEVDFVVSYIRVLPTLSPAQLALARQAATDGSVWLFSSSQALQNLKQILPGQDWSMARAVASHPRIEKAARLAGFGAVKLTRPVLNELMASIESYA
jgi:uroporphyrinogen-III synthase